MVSCKIVHVPKSGAGFASQDDANKELVRFITEDFAPLLEKHWARESNRTGVPHCLDMPAFMAAWEQGGIILIMAYEEGVAIGFMVCYKFRPLFQDDTLLHVERWQGSESANEAMFQYLQTILPIMGLRFVHAIEHEQQHIPDDIVKDEKLSYRMTRIGV